MANKTDQEDAEAHRARLKNQRADQAKHRAKNKAKRRPERNEVASAVLRIVLTSTVRHPQRISTWITAISRDLAGLKKPFEPTETTAVFTAMIERHREAMEQAAQKRAAEQGRGT